MPVQPSIWELEGDVEAVVRQITLGGQQELELWLLLAQRRAEYIPQAAIVAQASSSSPGDRSVLACLRSYDPDKEFMVVLVKDDRGPRRLIASYTYSALSDPKSGDA